MPTIEQVPWANPSPAGAATFYVGQNHPAAVLGCGPIPPHAELHALATHAPASAAHIGINHVEGVPIHAVGRASKTGRHRLAAQVVGLLGDGFQMVRQYAPSCATKMVDLKSWGDGADALLVKPTVGVHLLVDEPENTIPAGIGGSRPNHTITLNGDLGPESRERVARLAAHIPPLQGAV